MTATTVRPLRRRFLGLLLIVYGFAGLLLVAGGAVLVVNSVARLDGLTQTLQTQRDVLVRSLGTTSTFLRDARTGIGNVQASLTATVDSARQTATLTHSLATAMGDLATASTISIFGAQPFAALGGTFSAVAGQASSMSTSLETTAQSLVVNATDLSHVTTDLTAIQADVDELQRQLSAVTIGTADISGTSRALDATRIVLGGLLGWLAVQAVIAIAAGFALARWRSPATDRDGAS